MPVARWKGYGGEIGYADASFDTFCWAAGLLAATRNVHVFSTVHVSTVHPLVAAKQLMTIDHLSGGRSGLNVVGGWFRPELEMFGPDHLLEHSRRYDLAEEWTKVVSLFWTQRRRSSTSRASSSTSAAGSCCRSRCRRRGRRS